MKRLAIIPGEGIGPEIALKGIDLIRTLKEYHGEQIEAVVFNLQKEHYIKDTQAFSRSLARELLKNYHAILFGAIGSGRTYHPASSRNLYNHLKKELDLYLFFTRVNPQFLLRADLTEEKIKSPVVLIRENHEGTLRFMHNVQLAAEEELESRCLYYSKSETRRVIKYAFEYALKYNHQTLYLIDDPGWRGTQTVYQKEFASISGEYEKSGIKTVVLSTHAGIVEILSNPDKIKLIVSPGYAGGLLAHLLIALQGGWGISCFAAVNPGQLSIFAPLHGSQSALKGKDIANPMAFFNSVSLALSSIGLYKSAKIIEESIIHALKNRWVTPDLGGSLGTDDVSNYICNYISDLKLSGAEK